MAQIAQIAACVFTNLNPEKGTLEVRVEKLYLYLNNLGIGEGGHALVHNGRDFGVVRVVRNFTPSLENPIRSKVQITKPLLCPLWITPSDVVNAMTTIVKIEKDSQTARLNKAAAALFEPEKETPMTTYPPPPTSPPDYEI